jgi:hypothetical protein
MLYTRTRSGIKVIEALVNAREGDKTLTVKFQNDPELREIRTATLRGFRIKGQPALREAIRESAMGSKALDIALNPETVRGPRESRGLNTLSKNHPWVAAELLAQSPSQGAVA